MDTKTEIYLSLFADTENLGNYNMSSISKYDGNVNPKAQATQR